MASCFRCGTTPDVVFDVNGKLRISYIDTAIVQYGTLESGTWQIEPVSPPTISATIAALDTDSRGFLHIACNDNSGTRTRMSDYATLNDDVWETEVIGSNSGFTVYDLKLTSQDVPIVASFVASGRLEVVTKEVAGWSSEIVGAGGLGASLVLDSSDVPHIGHVLIGDDELRYATTANGAWTNEVVQSLGADPLPPSLDLGPNDQPRSLAVLAMLAFCYAM